MRLSGLSRCSRTRRLEKSFRRFRRNRMPGNAPNVEKSLPIEEFPFQTLDKLLTRFVHDISWQIDDFGHLPLLLPERAPSGSDGIRPRTFMRSGFFFGLPRCGSLRLPAHVLRQSSARAARAPIPHQVECWPKRRSTSSSDDERHRQAIASHSRGFGYARHFPACLTW